MGELARLVMNDKRSAMENYQLMARLDKLDALLSKTEPVDQWHDYSEKSVLVGWSAFDIKKIHYRLINNMVWVNFYISGTSNNTVATFTVPFVVSNVTFEVPTVIRVVNGASGSAAGLAIVAAGYDNVQCFSSVSAAAFLNTGNKLVCGWVLYQRGSVA